MRESRLVGLELELPLRIGTPTGEAGLDPDGVPLGELEEPSSPDKETVAWPGR